MILPSLKNKGSYIEICASYIKELSIENIITKLKRSLKTSWKDQTDHLKGSQ